MLYNPTIMETSYLDLPLVFLVCVVELISIVSSVVSVFASTNMGELIGLLLSLSWLLWGKEESASKSLKSFEQKPPFSEGLIFSLDFWLFRTIFLFFFLSVTPVINFNYKDKKLLFLK